MKQYFAYKQGSYWIYKDDSTGTLDSTYVNYYFHGNGNKDIPAVTREVIAMNFNSNFLTQFTIAYIGNNCHSNKKTKEEILDSAHFQVIITNAPIASKKNPSNNYTKIRLLLIPISSPLSRLLKT
jgi:hypothetical protein